MSKPAFPNCFMPVDQIHDWIEEKKKTVTTSERVLLAAIDACLIYKYVRNQCDRIFACGLCYKFLEKYPDAKPVDEAAKYFTLAAR